MNEIYEGDSLETVKTLNDKSVDCVITSPPYWQLRDYGYPEQWGLEPTYQEYLEHLWSLMDELWRVLKDTGTVWINLGDSYGGSSTVGRNDAERLGGLPSSTKGINNTTSKCLLLIPHRFAIGCIDRGWILRNDIIWAKRNGMPESVTDRFSKKHEYFFLMVKQQKYYFDLDGVRSTPKQQSIDRLKRGVSENNKWVDGADGQTPHNLSQPRLNVKKQKFDDMHDGLAGHSGYSASNPSGPNPGDVSDFWDIPTQPSSAKHYATFNTDLIDKPIVAGCPEFVCTKCGKPREKIIETEKYDYKKSKRQITGAPNRSDSRHNTSEKPSLRKEIVGLTDCGCNAGFEGGIILDPFCGTGTTLIRGLQLNRQIIGIDGSKEYCEIAEKRIEQELAQLKLAL